MSSNTLIEERLSAVEAAIAELRQQSPQPPTPDWLDQVSGIMRGEPAFEEVVKLGEQMRRSAGHGESDGE